MLDGDIDIQRHPGAADAGLVRGARRWFLTFTGPPGFKVELQVITDNELGDVLSAGYSDSDVVAYIERRMGVAGYIVTRQVCRLHTASWTLT